MKHTLESSVHIHANPQQVWKVFSDFDSYAAWNPFIKSISGKLEPGKSFRAEIGTMKFRPKLLRFEVGKEMTWIGRLLIPGIFDGKHSFVLEEQNDGTTLFMQSEEFSGILVGMLRKRLDTEILQGFQAMNKELKLRAEATAIGREH